MAQQPIVLAGGAYGSSSGMGGGAAQTAAADAAAGQMLAMEALEAGMLAQAMHQGGQASSSGPAHADAAARESARRPGRPGTHWLTALMFMSTAGSECLLFSSTRPASTWRCANLLRETLQQQIQAAPPTPAAVLQA